MNSTLASRQVHYLGFFETARLSFVQSLPPPINPSVVTAMLQGRGVGFVVKSHNIVYKSPVHHPDSLVIACRPHTISPVESPSSFSIAVRLPLVWDNQRNADFPPPSDGRLQS
jgi:acyl-CoA thioesterase FadM